MEQIERDRDIESLHHLAMEFASSGQIEEALTNEMAAASLWAQDGPNLQPTRSVLYRSAASLAYQLGKYGLVEILTAAGLENSPPQIIVEELWDLRITAREEYDRKMNDNGTISDMQC